MAERSPHPIDSVVGQNIRFYRLKKGISQEALADHLGLTFQQVQKYEKGTNRTSASRLVHIASFLGVGITALFDGVDVAKGTADASIGKLLKDTKAVELLQAFAAIKDRDLKSTIVALAEQVADS